MVTVTVLKTVAVVAAFWPPFLQHEVAFEDFTIVLLIHLDKFQTRYFGKCLEQARTDDDIVEEVPPMIVDAGTESFVMKHPKGIEIIVLFY
jgi:hypothetical protein